MSSTGAFHCFAIASMTSKAFENELDRAASGESLAAEEPQVARIGPSAKESKMGFLWIIIVGAVVGALARLLMPGRDPAGFFVTAILGMVGAVVATLLGRALGLYGPDQAAGFVASILGAVLVLYIYKSMRKRQA